VDVKQVTGLYLYVFHDRLRQRRRQITETTKKTVKERRRQLSVIINQSSQFVCYDTTVSYSVRECRHDSHVVIRRTVDISPALDTDSIAARCDDRLGSSRYRSTLSGRLVRRAELDWLLSRSPAR